MAAGHAIGVDVGGTKIAAGIVDLETGSILHRAEAPTQPERGGQFVLDRVRSLAGDAMRLARDDELEISAIGLGVCEIVDSRGLLRSANLIDWRHQTITDTIEGSGFHLVSDVRAAAFAEARWGAASGTEHVLYVSIGTGIASVLLIGGVPYAGAHGAALVLASALRLTNDQGIRAGVLEDVASGPGLARQFGNADGDARPLFAAAIHGNPRALGILAQAAQPLGDAIGQLVNCLDPELLVTGGGIGSLSGPYHDYLQARITACAWTGINRRLRIARARLGNDAGIAGAALSAACRRH